MARAYQYTIFQLIKKSLGALTYSFNKIADPLFNSKNLRILTNVNNKIALLKGNGIKLFDLSKSVRDQYDTVVVPLQQFIELGLIGDNKYFATGSQNGGEGEDYEMQDEEMI